VHLVFLYKLTDTYATGILDARNATVLMGAISGWVIHAHPAGTERYFIESTKSHLHFVVNPEDVRASVDYMGALQLDMAENPLPPQEGRGPQETPVSIPFKKNKRSK